MHRHNFLIISLFFGCIAVLLYGLFQYWDFIITDFGIFENKVIKVPDNYKTQELIAKNTPVRVEIVDQRWGKTVIEDPAILFDIWSLLKKSQLFPSKYLVNHNRINGYVYFYDGSKQAFCISDSFQLSDSIIENSEEDELDIKKLYRILQYTLATKNNLMEMVETADAVYLYRAEDSFDPESGKMVQLTDKLKQKLLFGMAQSHKVADSNKLNHLLLEGKAQPFFHVALSFKEAGTARLIIISILSKDYFNVMDMSYINRNISYFEGPLFNFCYEIFASNSSG
jgi:hypothetical protein